MKRFWKEVSVEQHGDGWQVLLDAAGPHLARRMLKMKMERFVSMLA